MVLYKMAVNKPDRRFPDTRWSLIFAARGAQTLDTRRALERLFEVYWYPVYAFIRSRSTGAAEAEDMTQGFFASMLSRSSLETVRPEFGRFRAFLLAAAKHYLSVERARARTEKRGGGGVSLPLDFALADTKYRLEASADFNPETQFERKWAQAAFEAAEEKLRREFVRAGKAVQFEALRQYLEPGAEPSYAEIASALEMSEAAVKVAVHRLRRRFGRVLREQIAQTVAAEHDRPATERAVEDEVRYLFRILGRQ